MSISSGQSKASAIPQFFQLALAGEAGLLLLAWGLARWLGVSPGEYLQPNLSAVLWGLVATTPLLLALAWMLTSSVAPIRSLVDLVTEQIGPLVSGCSVLKLGCLAAVAGLSEEVLFRGVIQPAMQAWMPVAGALVVTSALFGLVHAASRVYALVASAMGLYLGTLFVVQGNLIPPILTHGLYDFVALIAVAKRYRNRQE